MKQYEFTERLHSVTTAVKTLQDDIRDADLPDSLQARLDGIRSALETMTNELTTEQQPVPLSEAKYRTLLETIEEGYVFGDVIRDDKGVIVDYQVTEANAAYERHTGFRIADTIGRPRSQWEQPMSKAALGLIADAVESGKSTRLEYFNEVVGRWIDTQIIPHGDQFANVFADVTVRKRHETRQNYLLKLSDALRTLSDALAIQQTAARILGEFLDVDCALYNEIRDDGETIHIEDNYVRNNFPKVIGDFPVRAFGAAMEVLRRGEILTIEDQTVTPLKNDGERTASTSLGVFASATVPLIKEGRWVANFGVLHSRPRKWNQDEIDILKETAERTWEAVQRARAEAAEREQRLLAEALRDTAIALSRTLKMDEVLEVALISVSRIVPYDAGIILLTEKGCVTEFHAEGLTAKDRTALERWHRKKANIDTTSLYRTAATDHKPALLMGEKIRSLRLPAAFGSAVLVKPLLHQDTVIGYFTLISRETTRFSEKDFQKLQALAYQVVIAVESAKRFQQAQELVVLQERNAIARELHDAVSQTLFSASIITEAMAKQLVTRSPEEMIKMLHTVHRLVQSAMAEMRTLLLELRPAHVYSTPFTQLLKQLITAAIGRKNIEAKFAFEGEPRLPPEVHFALYRVTQEAVNNILKHAHAAQFTITGTGGPNFIDLRIQDNGGGFDPKNASSGMGLGNMRERAAEVGSQLTLRSVMGDGTEIRVVWPKDGGKAGTK